MTLQGESAKLTDRYCVIVGLLTATPILLKKQKLYQLCHGLECRILRSVGGTTKKNELKSLKNMSGDTYAGMLSVTLHINAIGPLLIRAIYNSFTCMWVKNQVV